MLVFSTVSKNHMTKYNASLKSLPMSKWESRTSLYAGQNNALTTSSVLMFCYYYFKNG